MTPAEILAGLQQARHLADSAGRQNFWAAKACELAGDILRKLWGFS